MAGLKKDGNENQRQRRDDPNALMRQDQPDLIRDPFQLMREMMTDPFRVFQQMAPWRREIGWNPSFEVRETDDGFVFKGDMPGVRDSDLDVSISGNHLQITGKREREEESDEGTLYTYERSYGQFSRAFTLPDSADLDKVRCDLKDGVLTLVVPKKPGSGPQRRKIQIGGGTKS